MRESIYFFRALRRGGGRGGRPAFLTGCGREDVRLEAFSSSSSSSCVVAGAVRRLLDFLNVSKGTSTISTSSVVGSFLFEDRVDRREDVPTTESSSSKAASVIWWSVVLWMVLGTDESSSSPAESAFLVRPRVERRFVFGTNCSSWPFALSLSPSATIFCGRPRVLRVETGSACSIFARPRVDRPELLTIDRSSAVVSAVASILDFFARLRVLLVLLTSDSSSVPAMLPRFRVRRLLLSTGSSVATIFCAWFRVLGEALAIGFFSLTLWARDTTDWSSSFPVFFVRDRVPRLVWRED